VNVKKKRDHLAFEWLDNKKWKILQIFLISLHICCFYYFYFLFPTGTSQTGTGCQHIFDWARWRLVSIDRAVPLKRVVCPLPSEYPIHVSTIERMDQ
jgi:hypothetical protein